MINKLLEKYKLDEKRFPSRAEDFNKVPNADGFWDWDVSDAAKVSGIRDLKPKKIADILFWLNMVVQGWELKNK